MEKTTKKYRIYLDDVRTPINKTWTIVRNYDEFVFNLQKIGFDNIEIVSLDHDLDETAMKEWSTNVVKNYKINYDNIKEKTGYHCAKWLIDNWLNGEKVFDVYTHSANAIGSANIMGIINNYRHLHNLPQNCVRINIEHTI
jgi:hypothetical protein